MDRYCFFYFAQLFLVASYVTQLYERYSQVPGADMRTKMVKSRSSAAGSSFRNDYVGTVTFVSEKGSSDWHAIVDNNIYCQLRSLTDGLPTDKPVVVGASIWLDAKRENGQSWVCTRIHDLWIPKNLPADSETRENPSAKHPENQDWPPELRKVFARQNQQGAKKQRMAEIHLQTSGSAGSQPPQTSFGSGCGAPSSQLPHSPPDGRQVPEIRDGRTMLAESLPPRMILTASREIQVQRDPIVKNYNDLSSEK